ncbi:choice-of-anchor D domain-containing protein [Formosa maritima]|uniref:Choice-of-anchor D domain-containing protein n=1 Tax=Formosa maritima TaxID=2592046 RepID=A0A5D0GAS5_9FLAO|nr:choice-of-anchor D domain-containing protein [Formosa maritima]TYA56046.1 choice-of-anchor D domain-containing protein [Formosa maritima]
MKNITLKELCLLTVLMLTYTCSFYAQEIGVLGNGTYIADNDVTPTTTDWTNFGTVNSRNFTIDNIQTSGNTTLNITGITLSNTTDFSVSTNPSPVGVPKNGPDPTFTITFIGSGTGTFTSTVTITSSNASNDGADNAWVFTISADRLPEINIQGNGQSIAHNDATPTTTDRTDFGSIDVSLSVPHTFTIQNTGNAPLSIGAITFGGANPGDFSITAAPASTVAIGASTTFQVTFTPSAVGVRTGRINIVNNDSDENPYAFTIRGTGLTPQPEINITGLSNTIVDGDTTPSVTDDTNFGSTGTGSPINHTFNIQNTGSVALTIGAITFSGANPGDFSVTTPPAASVAASGNTNFIVAFNPSGNGTRSATISIVNNDSNENPYDFTIQGTGVVPLTEGPGGVTNDLALWLKGTDGLGYTDGQSVSLWADQGRGANATVNTAGQEPTYYDNPTQNVNFNPVVNFDNIATESSGSYNYSNLPQQYLQGSAGYYTNDMFAVVIPNQTVNSTFGSMDIFCADHDILTQENDGSGLGFGAYSQRFSGEVLCYAYALSNGVNNGYGVSQNGASITYDNVGIINARHNTAVNNQELYYNAVNKVNNTSDAGAFGTIADGKYWIGRSEGWRGSLDGRVCEIITYSARKNDTDLTVERNRIQSYLAIKYGITLGVNGTSQDYVDSSGSVIWDANTGVPANDVFNYDIAGIGRDDDSDLLQKQSRSVNNATDGGFRAQGVLTIGMGSIANTNNLNTNTELEDKEYLVWGNNGVDLDTALPDITVNMSSDIAPALTTDVSFEAISRTWKVVENVGPGGDIPTVEVAILKSAVRTATPPDGRYLMFISDTPNFDPTADYRVMTEGTNELGEAILKTNYDFDDTKYITFGWAPERTFERSVYFNGSTNYIDMEDALDLNATAFTISAWVKRESGSLNKSILSKRDAPYTEGYDFKINASGNFEVSWYSSGTKQSITSNTIIPENTWHHLAIIYQSTTAKLYIDGVLDIQSSKTDPDNNTNQSFYIGAASKLAPEAFFNGNIDEVRVWNTAITEGQLRYIMNQEIEENSGFVSATYFVGTSITPTKNEIATIPWTALAGYYPMSTYTYTNTKDESGNGHQGALRTLRTVDRQTAPLPYKSNGSGNWDANTTWLNGSLQTIPGANSIVDPDKTIDWNIVETDHNIIMNNSSLATSANGNRNLLALNNKTNTITVDGTNNSNDADNSTEDGTGFGLTITHFLNISGKIDLEGESQLIQTLNSDLVVGASGILEKDQQGSKDLFTYNYWSSPVGYTDAGTNNYSYTLNNHIFKDGTNSSSPANISFVGGYNGSSGSPIGIAHYWIWKYANLESDNYSLWQHVRNTGTIKAGEGFTMKGVANTSGDVEQEQNYVFQGKPNNGDILTLTLNAGNDYLIGNPYASAIDADRFIMDNGNTLSYSDPGGMPETDPLISGTLYFWEHWGGGSHVTAEYQGGYGTYNFSGGVPGAGFLGTSDPDVNQTGTGTKTPGRYIPVGQGFFVTGQNTGLINFNNGQRVFKKEGSTSVFVKQAGKNLRTENDFADSRMKIRLGFNSINTIHRQLLVTEDTRATLGVDWGFDGLLYQNQMDDMYWSINNDKYTIQGVDNISESTVLPIGVHTSDPGINNFIIDALENVPENLNIYIHDKELNIYHDLRVNKYEIYLEAGEYLDRFEITFTNQSLSIEEIELVNTLQVSYVNASESIVIQNPKFVKIKSAELLNAIGQSINTFENFSSEATIEIQTKKLSAGTYIIKLQTEIGVVNKKVLVN